MIYIHIYIESQVYRHYTYYIYSTSCRYQRVLVSPLHVDSKIVDASHIPKVSCLYVNFVRIYLKIYAFLAQLDRAIVFEAIGYKFESCRAL